MPKKPKFKPQITRVKLNPEQAVLQCLCFDSGWDGQGDNHPAGTGCDLTTKANNYFNTASGTPLS